LASPLIPVIKRKLKLDAAEIRLATFELAPAQEVPLNRATWFYLDLCAAGVFIGHLIFVRQKFA
jgi:hypothetical protein